MPPIHLIQLTNCPIYDQLQLEEALLRTDLQNICLINLGTEQKAIVMGISAPIQEHLNLKRIQELKIPVIKRFSGGGTVFVDSNTFFVTFIFNKQALKVEAFPEPILKWSEVFYQKVFETPDFALRENDYVLKKKKFGGNAKYIQKDRWLLHTSFLWDYSNKYMELLKNPQKAPKYREGRTHEDFLTKMKTLFPYQDTFLEKMTSALKEQFEIVSHTKSYPEHFLKRPHRKTTEILKLF